MKIAVFPCGTEIGLEIGRSLRFEKNIELIGLSSVDCHGKFIYDNYRSDAPYITDERFLPWLRSFRLDNNIDIVIPANDAVLEYFALNDQPTYHPKETILTCASKSKTYEALKDVVRVPIQYTANNHPYECFLKPDKGHSGIGCYHITSDAQFDAHYNGQLILEYCEGEEFTVDCFSVDGKLIYSLPRIRDNIRSGISATTQEVMCLDSIITSAIMSEIEFNGAWFYQFKLKDNKPVLMEVAARIGGSSGSSKTIGVNLPLMDIHNHLGSSIDINRENLNGVRISRSLSVKSELPEVDNIYIDLDDTMILKGVVNWQIMAFIYKYKDKKNIHLLTRNKNPYKVLDEYRLSIDLFKTICVCKSDQQKADFVKDGLLIDDSWNERKDCMSIDPNSVDLYL